MTTHDSDDERWMREALAEAMRADAHGDVPVGAVIVVGGQAIGRGHNRREADRDPTAHAEVLAIREAARALGTWYLVDAVLYVTQEPCPMCAGALVNARVDRLVYGVADPKAGAAGTLFDILRDERLNHRVAVESGVLGEECGALLRDFFRARR